MNLFHLKSPMKILVIKLHPIFVLVLACYKRYILFIKSAVCLSVRASRCRSWFQDLDEQTGPWRTDRTRSWNRGLEIEVYSLVIMGRRRCCRKSPSSRRIGVFFFALNCRCRCCRKCPSSRLHEHGFLFFYFYFL